MPTLLEAETQLGIETPPGVRQALEDSGIDMRRANTADSLKQLIDLLPLSPDAIEFGKHMIGREVIEAALLGENSAGQTITGLDAVSTDRCLIIEVSKKSADNLIGRSTRFIDGAHRGGLPETVISYLGKIGEYSRANNHALETDILKPLPAW